MLMAHAGTYIRSRLRRFPKDGFLPYFQVHKRIKKIPTGRKPCRDNFG